MIWVCPVCSSFFWQATIFPNFRAFTVIHSDLISESTEYHNQEVKELGEVKESLGMQLKTLQEILDNQIEKYKEQVMTTVNVLKF